MGRKASSRFTWACIIIGTFAAVGCSSKDSTDNGSASDCELSISRFKELEIVDEDVVSDPRAKNETGGPWSFRHVAEQIAPPGVDPGDFIYQWLDTYRVDRQVNRYPVGIRTRVTSTALCPWLQARPENQCDAQCGSCAERKLDLAKAPFRLIGIANRLDLWRAQGAATAGEGRLIYALTAGPGDSPDSRPTEMSVIFEFTQRLSKGRSIKYWADRWHSLGSHEAFDDSYRTALEGITNELVTRDDEGTALSQVRVNERVFEWDWQLREFRLDGTGALRTYTTENTPDISVNGTPELKQYIERNFASIEQGEHHVPGNLLGGLSNPMVRWYVPGLSEEKRHAFAKETCSGCHQTEVATLDINFQVSPFRKGIAKLAPFLHDPVDPKHDDLARREKVLAAQLCGQ